MVALPQQSHADVVAAALCAVQQYPCVGANILDSGIRNDGLNLLGANTFDIMNFSFADAAVTFNGTMMATDIAGRWIYLWGSGTATDVLGGALNLDVAFTESYRTVPGNWTFNDMIVGGCAGGTGPNSGAIAQGVVNATGLSVIGGNCSNFNPFASVGIPVNGNLGGLTRLTGAAQFVFTAGSAPGSTVTLPWGDDFPDPAINFNDPSNPINDIDPTDDSGLGLQPTPEPGALPWLAGAIVLLGMARHRASRRNRLLANVSL
jgi:hypothetical protein